MAIGENLKRLRTNKGLTQVQLSEAVGITQAMLAQIERGTKTLSFPVAYEISKELECNLYDFLDNDADKKSKTA